MECPLCGHKSKIAATMPARQRPDGYTYRRRLCLSPECAEGFSTYEMTVDTYEVITNGGTMGHAGPNPVTPGKTLVNIEERLEGLLEPSLDAIRDAIIAATGQEPSQQKVQTARWLIQDRRDYRKALAEAKGAEEHNDPQIKELANLLKMVPDEDAA
jgi:hypothetical protein